MWTALSDPPHPPNKTLPWMIPRTDAPREFYLGGAGGSEVVSINDAKF